MSDLTQAFWQVAYIVAALCVVLAIKWLSSPVTARRGVFAGELGMLLCQRGQKPFHIPTVAQEVFDVSGAGDTAIAAFTLALAAGATGIEAAEIANHAAGVVVGKLGTATLNVDELHEMFIKTEGVA